MPFFTARFILILRISQTPFREIEGFFFSHSGIVAATDADDDYTMQAQLAHALPILRRHYEIFILASYIGPIFCHHLSWFRPFLNLIHLTFSHKSYADTDYIDTQQENLSSAVSYDISTISNDHPVCI